MKRKYISFVGGKPVVKTISGDSQPEPSWVAVTDTQMSELVSRPLADWHAIATGGPLKAHPRFWTVPGWALLPLAFLIGSGFGAIVGRLIDWLF